MPLSLYIYVYVYIHLSLYVYIYIYIYMADSPHQRQLKTQKCITFACELKNIPYQSKTHRGYMKKHTPHYGKKPYYAFLARFVVCLGVALRGLWKGECPLPTKCIAVSMQESIPEAYPRHTLKHNPGTQIGHNPPFQVDGNLQ